MKRKIVRLLLAFCEGLQGKVPTVFENAHKDTGEVDVKYRAFVTSALGLGECSVLHSSHFNYEKKQEAGWDTEPIGQG